MAITTPLYASREDVKRSLDYKETARNNTRIDDALMAAGESVEGLCHRGHFYPTLATRYFDWPGQQPSRAWVLWLDQNGIISLDSLITGGETIPPDGYFLEPVNDGPPYTSIEINLASQSAFQTGLTTQRDIAAMGMWGYRNTEVGAGTFTAAASDSATTVLVSDSRAVETGALLRTLAGERMLVTGRSLLATGHTLQTPLASSNADNLVQPGAGAGATYSVGETLTLDGERMHIDDIAGDALIVQRAVDGSPLAAHTGSVIYAPRSCTVVRGVLGTAAAAVGQDAAVARWVAPSLVHDLTIAYASNTLLQQNSGYARTVGNSAAAMQRAVASVVANIGDLEEKLLSSGMVARRARQAAI